jgi:hypothetical protein
MFNWYWSNPAFPVSSVRGGDIHIYDRAEEPADLGDEAFVGTPKYSAGNRRLVFVRQGNQIFSLNWLSSIKDVDHNQILVKLARLVSSRL